MIIEIATRVETKIQTGNAIGTEIEIKTETEIGTETETEIGIGRTPGIKTEKEAMIMTGRSDILTAHVTE